MLKRWNFLKTGFYEGINLPSKITTRIEPDHVIVTETPGGGGWGDPRHRDAEAVRHDVLEGLVSMQRTRKAYCVVIDAETMELDETETRRLRSGG